MKGIRLARETARRARLVLPWYLAFSLVMVLWESGFWMAVGTALLVTATAISAHALGYCTGHDDRDREDQ